MELKNQSLIIVLRGDFNPSIFHPLWFAQNKMMSEKEVEQANLKLVHPDISDFSIDWLTIQVTRDRFLLRTTQESHFEALQDIVLGSFSLLRFTPIRQLGINFEGQHVMKSLEERNAYGDKLAPKEIWRGNIKNPGLNSLQMKCDRNDDYGGYIMVTVRPSSELSNGVSFHVNDHYELSSGVKDNNALELLEVFSANKSESINNSKEIIKLLLEN